MLTMVHSDGAGNGVINRYRDSELVMLTNGFGASVTLWGFVGVFRWRRGWLQLIDSRPLIRNVAFSKYCSVSLKVLNTLPVGKL